MLFASERLTEFYPLLNIFTQVLSKYAKFDLLRETQNNGLTKIIRVDL